MTRTMPVTNARLWVWCTPVAVLAALAEIALIVLGTRARFPDLLVWVPAVAGMTLTVAVLFGAAAVTGGALRAFWRRMAVGLGFVLLAAVSQIADIRTLPWVGVAPVSARTMLLYVAGTALAIVALLRLPGGSRTWRQLTTAVLDVAVVAVTAGIAASEYVNWSTDRFDAVASAWWLNVTILAITVAGVVVVVKIMSASSSPVPRTALWWLAPIGLAGPLSTVLMTAFAPWPHLNGSAAVLPFVGLLAVLAARAQRRDVARSGTPSSRAQLLAAYPRGTAVPLVATVLTSVLVAGIYLQTGRLSTFHVTGTTLLLLLVVARQGLALAENTSLLNTVAHQAMHDDLTGLAARRHFTAAAAGATGPHTVVLIDVKDLRAINDGLGAEAGDALLVAIARRLRRLAGDDAVVARLGGDEFGVLLPGDRSVTTATVDRLLAATAEPLNVAGHEVLVEVSAGIADGGSGLHRQAELALREAAAGAGGGVVRYDASLERRLSGRATMAADLRRALATGEFHMLYQPIVELPDGRTDGVESLVRWTRADGVTVSPADFIPVAEDTGLIVELGAWIIDTVCAQAAEWRRRHGADALRSVAVNVSARQLLDPGLPDVVAAALARHGLPAGRLTIEITETAVFGGGRALATVTALSRLGVSIALDDFGTGHSSLGLLRTCPVDAIKVDKSFVDGLGGTPQQEAIATAVIGIARTMGLRTVAEGVETAAQAQRLSGLGYRHAQGFHFARPMSAAAVDEMLALQVPPGDRHAVHP